MDEFKTLVNVNYSSVFCILKTLQFIDSYLFNLEYSKALLYYCRTKKLFECPVEIDLAKDKAFFAAQ